MLLWRSTWEPMSRFWHSINDDSYTTKPQKFDWPRIDHDDKIVKECILRRGSEDSLDDWEFD